MAALAGSAVPVPKSYGLCTDDTVIGSAFYVMDFVDGRVFWEPHAPGLSGEERRALFASMNQTTRALPNGHVGDGDDCVLYILEPAQRIWRDTADLQVCSSRVLA